MNILVTAGNTQTPLDRVRCITNIFSGRTGTGIALRAAELGHSVTLLTSHPELAGDRTGLRVHSYRTFNDLETLMAREIASGSYAAIIHAAAVNDYLLVGTFTRRGEEFVDVSAAKVKGNHEELWLQMRPAPKLVDQVRGEWRFTGKLVKFKLEVNATDAELLDIAEKSRVHSGADLMVANTLEGMGEWAFIGAGDYRRVSRAELADAILKALDF